MSRNEKPKIAIIGAASSSFSGLLADLIASRTFDGAKLALVDIDSDGLDVMTRLGRRMAKEWDRTTVVESADVETALTGADFVIPTIAVGGLEAWRMDDEIPAKYGYFGHSVDTVGPGGLFRGLRLIPPLMNIARQIERLCPDAWVINYSNPMSGVCRALRKAASIKVVGLCTAGNVARQAARDLKVDVSRVEVISGGVNHCVWVQKVLVDGRDATDRFIQRMRELHTNEWAHASVELLNAFGHWPMPGSSHVAEFFPYFYGNDPDGRTSPGRYRIRESIDFDAKLKLALEQREKLNRQAAGDGPLGHVPEESGSEAVEMITSIWTGRRTRHYANVANQGLIPNLPDNAVVEIPILADGAGIRGLQVGPIPESVAGMVNARCAYYGLLADAAIHRSKQLALQCLLNDVSTSSLARAKKCVDEMFEKQAQWLPDFK
jgi:alpha-galactosidase